MEKDIKILFVVKNMRVASGVASFVINYYRELINYSDIQIDLLVVSDVGSIYYEEISKRSNIYFMPSLRHPIRMILFLKKLFKENQYDILHSNVFNSNAPIVYYAKKNRVPIRIFHSHTSRNGDSILLRFRNKFFFLINIFYSNVFFACSKTAGEVTFKNKKFYLINNAINLHKYFYNDTYRNEIRNGLKISNDITIVGVVGRVTEAKNPDFIIEIAKKLKADKKKCKILWLGSGNLDEYVKKRIFDEQLEEQILLLGSVDEVYKYYSAFDVFIMPSIYEGLPIAGIEAQINGIKCILSSNISEEIKITNHCELIGIDNVENWCKMISSADMNRKKNEKALFYKYDIKYSANDLYKLYKHLLEGVK